MCSNCTNASWWACRVPMEREDLLVPLDPLDLEYVHFEEEILTTFTLMRS